MPDMEKVIKEAEEAIDILAKADEPTFWMDFVRCAFENALALLKEQEAKTGHWIDTTKVIGFPRVQCSVCGSGQGAIWMNYCPNCGAHMVKDS